MDNKITFETFDLYEAKANMIETAAHLMHSIMKLKRMYSIEDNHPQIKQVMNCFQHLTEEQNELFDTIVPIDNEGVYKTSLETTIFNGFVKALKSVVSENEGDASLSLMTKANGTKLNSSDMMEDFNSFVKDLWKMADWVNARFCTMNINLEIEKLSTKITSEKEYKYRILFKLILLNALYAVAELPIHERQIVVTLNNESFTIENTFNVNKPRVRKGSKFNLNIIQNQLGLIAKTQKNEGMYKLTLTFPKEI